jgi:hypothetical protein
LVVLTLAISAQPSRAQDLPTLAFAAAATTDWITTHENMQYFHERNPLLSWIDHKPNTMIALGASMDVATYYGVVALTKHRPKTRKVVLYSLAAFRVAVAAHNVWYLQKHRPRS